MKLLFQFHIYVYVNVCILDCDINCISHCGLRSKYFENYFFRERSVSKTHPQRLTSQWLRVQRKRNSHWLRTVWGQNGSECRDGLEVSTPLHLLIVCSEPAGLSQAEQTRDNRHWFPGCWGSAASFIFPRDTIGPLYWSTLGFTHLLLWGTPHLGPVFLPPSSHMHIS